MAVDHEHVAAAQAVERGGHERCQLGPGDAQELVLRPRRIGQRAKEVEDGADAELAAGGRGVLHRRVERLREHEAEAGLLDALGYLLR